jgi:hypothetical protein
MGSPPVPGTYAYVDQETPTDTPLQTAQTALNTANSKYARPREIEDALEAELATAHNRLLHRQTEVRKALSALVCNSAPFHQLFVELEAAWARLRSIRKCFYKI